MTIPAKWKALLSPLNLHLGGALLLVALNVYLALQMVVAIGVAHANSGDALEDAKVRLGSAVVAARPLEGLDTKLQTARQDVAGFERTRLAGEQSAVVAELGAIAQRSNVRLSRAQYTATPTEDDFIELTMDASLTGDYRPLVQFVNGMERDKIFFIINSVTLSGQQGGIVTLKLRMTTWLKPDIGMANPAKQKSDATTKPDVRGGQ